MHYLAFVRDVIGGRLMRLKERSGIMRRSKCRGGTRWLKKTIKRGIVFNSCEDENEKRKPEKAFFIAARLEAIGMLPVCCQVESAALGRCEDEW
jgi:hypothetical protein